MSPGKLVPGFPTDHRILWITPCHPAGGLWINFIFISKRIPEKPLKTGFFFDIIGTLYGSYQQVIPVIHILWKKGLLSTGFPQGFVDKRWKSRGAQERQKTPPARRIG